MTSALEIKRALRKKHGGYDWAIYFEVTLGRGGGRLDGLAVKKSWVNPCFQGYEIKTSRNDFKSDNKWTNYLDYCHKFYFVCPKGIISREEIEEMDENIGLIYYSPDYADNFHTMKSPLFKNIGLPSKEFLFRIIMSKLESDRYPFHSSKAEYFKKWLKNKENNRNLAYSLDGAIGDIIEDQEQKLTNIRFTEKKLKEKEEAIDEVFNYLRERNLVYGSSTNFNFKEKIDQILNSGLTSNDKYNIKRAIEYLDKIKYLVEEEDDND